MKNDRSGKGFKAKVFRFISISLWGILPGGAQRKISRVYANIYNRRWTKHLIKPYVRAHYDDPNYLDNYLPASQSNDYRSFQDFFTRVLKFPPQIISDTIWACEGLLCEYGKVSELELVKVKGQKRHLRAVFGEGGYSIPDDYYFSNVFLHNNNYHRIHAPINGTVTRIEHVPGDLVLLRPWAYKDPSLPALRNERINVDVVDNKGRKWYMSIVGGPGVGSIVLTHSTFVGASVLIGQEVATFLLGSTCCVAAPEPCVKSQVGDQVEMGDPL